MAYSLLVDVFWVLFWMGKWGHINHDLEKFIHSLVIIASIVGIFLKIVILFSLVVFDKSSIINSLPNQLKEKIVPVNYEEQVDEA